MHKKPLVAVFVLGLLLMAAAVAWGAPAPSKDGAVTLPPFVKGTRSTNLQTTPLETTPIVSAQAGTPLIAPGMLCSGIWMGPRTYRIGGTFVGGETYMTLQDPTGALPISWAVLPVCAPLGYNSFNVTAVNMELSKRPTSEAANPFTFALQPIIFDADLTTTPGCPLPGGVKCAGPVYAVTLTAGATAGVTFSVNLPFVIECCVTGPYFAAWYLAAPWASGIAQITVDNANANPIPVAPQICHQYQVNPDGLPPGLYDWGPWYNIRQWSDGYTPDDPATQCTPGICDWQNWNGVAPLLVDYTDPNLFAWTLPNASGSRDAISVRFSSDCQDTLKEIVFYGWAYVGTPDVLIEVRDPQPGSSCGMPTEPGALRHSVVVPYSSLVDDPLPNYVPMPNIVWGSLNGGLSQDLFVTLSVVGGLPNRYALLARTRVAGSCSPDPHTMYHVSGNWIYGGDYFGDDDEAYIQGYICREQCPIVEDVCSPSGPDDWNTWAHDYQRTSASSMNLGDPCKVRAQWKTFMPRVSSFTNPVVAGDRVYVSSDNEVNSYALATGIPGASVGTFPYTGGQVRSNVSVEGNRVFLTGGTGLSISCWSADLSTNWWSNDQTSGILGVGSNGPLAKRNRFGATAVYVIVPGIIDPLGDSIVVVGTEQQSTLDPGRLYALDVKTGFLYAPWISNPRLLDRGSWHSPSYDGTNLYVGTAQFGTIGDGSLYSINAATGVVNWNYKDAAAALEGWPGGVSVEGTTVYGSTYYNDAAIPASSGHRYSIDVSGAGPVNNWRHLNGPTLYAAPTVGRNFLYIPQDNPSAGVLMVDKTLGKAVYNWSADGVAGVSQNVALTCDKYLFAGDRFGYWYLLNATDQSMEWRREFGGLVNGTAIAHHTVTGDDYAVVGVRSSFTGPAGAGVVSAWRFNQTARPFLRQMVYETGGIIVPLNSGNGLFHSEPGVYANDGCVNLNFSMPPNVWEISPAAKMSTRNQTKFAEAYANRKTGSDYLTYFEGGVTKKQRLAGVGVSIAEDLTQMDKVLEEAHTTFAAKNSRGSMAAGANDVVRTDYLSIAYSSNPILPGGTTGLSWNYDGTLLGRALDYEIIESVNDDPDFYPEDLTYLNMGYPYLVVHYVGGCPDGNTTVSWNALGALNTEKVYFAGALGDGADGALIWGADAFNNTNDFDGGFMLVGDSTDVLGGAQVYVDYYGFKTMFVPDPRLSDNTCGFDGADAVLMGYRNDLSGGCPGVAVPIDGSWRQVSYSDTDFFYAPTSPLASMGTSITQTEIGANDPKYGDFKLIQWHVKNRDAVAKTNLKGGTHFDWDVVTSYANNVGLASAQFNGYAIWDGTSPRYAFGMLDPNMPTAYCGVDPVPNYPGKILVNSNAITYGHSPGEWGSGTNASHAVDLAYGWTLATYPPRLEVQSDNPLNPKEDRGGMLINKAFNLAAKGDPGDSYDVVQALYAVPAISNTDAGIDALGVLLGARAAKWAGFARGDVNDDGCVDLADVCWVLSQNQIYPDTYNGDVNLDTVVDGADQAYLLSYVSGIGPAPLGKFRFSY